MTVIETCADGSHHLADSLGDGLAFLEIRALVCDCGGSFVCEDRSGQSTTSDESALGSRI